MTIIIINKFLVFIIDENHNLLNESSFLRLFYDPECTDCADLGMISDIIRYIISWLGPFFAFAQSVFVIVDVQVGGETIQIDRNPVQLFQEKNAICANALPSNQLNQACQVSNTFKPRTDTTRFMSALTVNFPIGVKNVLLSAGSILVK